MANKKQQADNNRNEESILINLSDDEEEIGTDQQQQNQRHPSRVTKEDLEELEHRLQSESSDTGRPSSPSESNVDDLASCAPAASNSSMTGSPSASSSSGSSSSSSSGSDDSSGRSSRSSSVGINGKSTSTSTNDQGQSSMDKNNKTQQQEVITLSDGELEEWSVESVIDKRPKSQGSGFEYLLKWENYSGPPTWEPEENCECTRLIKKFERERMKKKLLDEQRIQERKLKLEFILGSIKTKGKDGCDDQMRLVVKWVGIDEPEQMPLEHFREYYPQDTIDFLLRHVVWDG